MRGHGGCITAAAFGEKGSQAHFGKQVEPVVAGGAVGAEADIDSGLKQSVDGGNAAGKFEVRRRAVRHRAAVACEECDFAIVQMHAVHGDQTRTQQAGFFEPGQRPHTVLRQTVGNFPRGFVDMNMHGYIQFTGISGDL